MTNPSKTCGDKDTPENKPAGKTTDAVLLTSRNWRRAPVPTSGAAEQGSPSARHVIDDDDTEDEHGDFDSGKQLPFRTSWRSLHTFPQVRATPGSSSRPYQPVFSFL